MTFAKIVIGMVVGALLFMVLDLAQTDTKISDMSQSAYNWKVAATNPLAGALQSMCLTRL